MVIRSGRIDLELHTLAEGNGPALLLLHQLFGSSRDWGRLRWPGPVFGLDFPGHGVSQRTRGGAYDPELLVSDADAALAQLGSAFIAGTGLGAYVALLLAGSRPAAVPGALLLPGRGLDGGGSEPKWAHRADDWRVVRPGEPLDGFDPLARTLRGDPRPIDYARAYADAANRLFLLEDHTARPPWWQAVAGSTKATAVGPDQQAGLTALADLAIAYQSTSATSAASAA